MTPRVRISPNVVSALLRYVPIHVFLRVYSPRSSTSNDFRPAFTIHDLRIRLSIASELPRYTTLVSRPRNCTSNVPRKTILYETQFYETYKDLRITPWPRRIRLRPPCQTTRTRIRTLTIRYRYTSLRALCD